MSKTGKKTKQKTTDYCKKQIITHGEWCTYTEYPHRDQLARSEVYFTFFFLPTSWRTRKSKQCHHSDLDFRIWKLVFIKMYTHMHTKTSKSMQNATQFSRNHTFPLPFEEKRRVPSLHRDTERRKWTRFSVDHTETQLTWVFTRNVPCTCCGVLKECCPG